MAQKHYLTCPLCEATCGLVAETDGERVVSIRGDADDPFSHGYICPKATALQDLHEDPDRLRTPVRRTPGGDWQPIAWGDAFDEVSVRIREVQTRHGSSALGIYLGNPNAHNLSALTYGQMFMRSLHTRNRFSATSADQLPHMLAALLMFGHQLLFPIPDVDRTDFMVILGGNPLASNGSLMTAPDIKQRLRAVRERGGRVIVIDPRRTETAALAGEHLAIRPGTDALLLFAWIHTLFDEHLFDLGRLQGFTDGVEDLRRAARRFPAEEVADVVGISADRIRTLARDFAAADRAVCYGRVGLCTQEFGGLAAWLVNAINVITGNLDREGGAMFASPAADIVKLTGRLGQRGAYARYRSRARNLPEFGGELPVAAMAEEIETPGKHQIRAMLTGAGNPVLSTPNGARLDRALEGLEFMASIDPYINETTRHAHVILPPTGPLERDHYDLAFYLLSVRNVAKYAKAVFPRAPEQRHEWEIYLELTERLLPTTTLGSFGRRALGRVGRKLEPRGMLDLLLRFGPHRLSVRKLEQNPHGIDLGPLEPRLPESLYTPGRRLKLAPAEYLADLDRLARRAGELRDDRALHLIGRRHLRSNNSWMHNSHRLVKGPERCTLLMHPDDARTRGLTHGQTVRVSSRAGAVDAPLEVSDEMMPGVVSLPHGWGHARPGVALSVAREHAGVSVNDLTDELFVDELSGNAAFSGVTVAVKRA